MKHFIGRLQRDGKRLVSHGNRTGIGPSEAPEIRRVFRLPGAVSGQEVGEHGPRVREKFIAHRLGLGVHNGEIVAYRAGYRGGGGERGSASQLDATVLWNKSRLRKLGGVVEVAE